MIRSKALFNLFILIGVNGHTVIDLESLALKTDVHRIANRSVAMLRIDARNLVVSQLAMRVFGDVQSLIVWISGSDKKQGWLDLRVINDHHYVKARMLRPEILSTDCRVENSLDIDCDKQGLAIFRD